MSISPTVDGPVTEAVLGPDLADGQRPQVIVAAGTWQAARPLDGDVLVGCTVSPAFTFEAFDLAPPDWAPGVGQPGDG